MSTDEEGRSLTDDELAELAELAGVAASAAADVADWRVDNMLERDVKIARLLPHALDELRELRSAIAHNLAHLAARHESEIAAHVTAGARAATELERLTHELALCQEVVAQLRADLATERALSNAYSQQLAYMLGAGASPVGRW